MARLKVDPGTPVEVPITEFKAHCLRLVELVRRRGGEIVITRHGKPVARVVSAEPQPAWRSPRGAWKGKVEIAGDIVSTDWSEEFEATRS